MSLEGSFIVLEIHQSWYRDDKTIKELVRRLAYIVAGNEERPILSNRFLNVWNGQKISGEDLEHIIEMIGFRPYKKDNDSWQLDMSNNWFFHIKDGVGRLHTRYWNIPELQALDIVIKKMLG